MMAVAGRPGTLALVAAALAAGLALGWLAWRLVEVPAASWLAVRLPR